MIFLPDGNNSCINLTQKEFLKYLLRGIFKWEFPGTFGTQGMQY